ncbi:MAG: hypothetical protein H6993_12645 [Pseudomonadales bacterium]|nr:hypothetical protein [Pseudomonadales bacterium]MCP5184806.1 hypothetical protein [Pseudomonadales bacterium]
MNELDAINTSMGLSAGDLLRLGTAIGVLLLMAASAAFGMLWQRQRVLSSALLHALTTRPTSASVPAAVTHALASTEVAADQEAGSKPAVTTPDFHAALQRRLAAEHAAAPAVGQVPATAPLAAGEPRPRVRVYAPLAESAARPAATPVEFPDEESRLRELLTRRVGVSESPPAPVTRSW